MTRDSKNADPSSAAQSVQPDKNETASGTTKKVILWRNLITIAGMYLAIIGLILLLTFGLFSVISPASNNYVDIFGYLGTPVLMVAGVVMMFAGILVKSWRIRRRDPTQKLEMHWPRIDLSDPQQRGVALLLGAGVFLMLPIIGVASYHGYHYTDSTQFCATACHTVMEPQGTAFMRSSHARVACAECHIGEGASWFVKSKLSGTRQVYRVIANNYSRPIPPAIRHLRPSRDTCEQCHWPEKFFGSQLRAIPHFSADEDNARTDVRMLVKTGGSRTISGKAEGIHAHMLELGAIEFVATDDYLQEIPWVRWENDGEVIIFRSDGKPASDPPPTGRRRTMDCMDCHNRPGHEFRSPNHAVNLALASERLNAKLPFIKREAVRAMLGEYPDKESAAAGIEKHLEGFYKEHPPANVDNAENEIAGAVKTVIDLYQENIFPYMHVDWRTYPNNIGHFVSPGCYRCHDGKHVSEKGDVIGHDCNTCHTFLNTASSDAGRKFITEGEFIHPWKFEGVHNELRCDQCHTGGEPPVPSCTGCHDATQALYTATGPTMEHFAIEPNPMADSLSCGDCHDVSEHVTLESMDAVCMGCHDDEPETYEGMLARWSDAISKARTEARAALDMLANDLKDDRGTPSEARTWLEKNQALFKWLDRAHPLHNQMGAQQIYETIVKEAESFQARASAN